MAYMTLYRKWRPARFEDVKGQDAIVRTLKNQIISDRVGHAYLFCGTRGTGKTTVSKILARAINCENPIDGSPCNECAVCRSILSGASMDVAEIDAASNNGVDNIRDIREQVQYPPVNGKYRVYIIDEVHMLSPGAFNALLKTLEEPPAYVVFILATTEPNKLPVTVLSRCQRYDFRRITSAEIAGQLSGILKNEGIAAEDAAVRYIAKAADGSMRDSLSLLEQCISFYFGQELTYDRVLEVLGAADVEIFSRLTRCISETDVKGCIRILDEISAKGKEPGQFVLDFTWYLRNMMLVQTADEGAEALDMSRENYERLREEAEQFDPDILMRDIRICSELSAQIRYSVSKRVLLETALIRMMQPSMEDDRESLKARIAKLEAAAAGGVFAQAGGAAGTGYQADGVSGDGQPGADSAARYPGGQIREKGLPEEAHSGNAPVVELSPAEFSDYETLRVDWNKITGSQTPFIASLLQGSRLGYDKDRGLCILFADSFKYAVMMQGSRMENLGAYLNREYRKEFRIFARVLEAGETVPKVVRGNRLPGIEMEIESE